MSSLATRDVCFDDAREADVEHIVARSKVHDGGVRAADVDSATLAADPTDLTLAGPR